jgi:hypothetical protein
MGYNSHSIVIYQYQFFEINKSSTTFYFELFEKDYEPKRK